VDYRASADALRNIQQVVRARVILVGEEVKHSVLGDGIPVWRLADIGISAQPYPMSTVEVGPEDVGEIVFTSGSTATPKGVIITHRNIVADLDPIEREVQKYERYMRPLYPIRFLNLLPLSHMFGQALATFFPPMLRGVVVFMHSYAPHEVISQIHRRRVSFLVTVPKMLEVFRQYVVRQLPELAGVKEDRSHWLKERNRAERSVRRWVGDNRAVVVSVMLGLLVAAWSAVKG
jgi:long-chain acyl-CoA synthetase